MAHATSRHQYDRLTERLNRFPQGASPSDLLFKILRILFSEREAELVAQLPIRPFTVQKAAQVWKMNEKRAKLILDKLAERALLMDFEEKGEYLYVLPPPMAGFFEFSLMRVRDDIDQKLLSELFYQYLNVEEEFVRDLFTEGDTQLGRTFVNEPALIQEVGATLNVLDYERASETIKTATAMGVGMCYCRHKMMHLERACEAPIDICMTFNTVAEALTHHGHARRVDVAEGLELLDRAYESNLVQFGENVRESVSFICNCCGCCCEALLAQKRFAVMDPIHTTNFIPVVDSDNCTGCGKCVKACPVEAMTMEESGKKKTARLDAKLCLGCGVCVRVCQTDGALRLESREQRVITPLDSTHRAVLMALERGKLQNLIFDNQTLWSHRALAAVLGAILRLPPVKRVMATEQVKSRYLEKLISRYS